VTDDQNSKTPAFAPVKLQQAIKGISIAAITYYLISILPLIFEGPPRKIGAFALFLWMFCRRGKPIPDG